MTKTEKAIEAIEVLREHCSIQRESSDDPVWTDDIYGLDFALSALRAQAARENPKPLTLDELRERNEKPVWIKVIDEDAGFWVLRSEWHDTRNPEPMILLHMQWHSHSNYGKTWWAYDYPPKEAQV